MSNIGSNSGGKTSSASGFIQKTFQLFSLHRNTVDNSECIDVPGASSYMPAPPNQSRSSSSVEAAVAATTTSAAQKKERFKLSKYLSSTTSSSSSSISYSTGNIINAFEDTTTTSIGPINSTIKRKSI